MKSTTPWKPFIRALIAHIPGPAATATVEPTLAGNGRRLRRRLQLQMFIGLSLCVLTIAARANAAIIYYDDFSGDSGSNLNGTSPDTRPGSETWSASTGTTGTFTNIWKANGSIAAPYFPPGHSYLPFVPEAGKIYTLSMHASVTGGPGGEGTSTANFFTLGFAVGNDVNDEIDDNYNMTAWMQKRGNSYTGSDDVLTYLGPGSTVGASHDLTAGAMTMKVVLNTQPTLWTVEWFADNTSLRGPVAFASNPTITHVGFGAFQNTTGTVDDFTLVVVPEPTSWLIAASAGVVSLIAYRRRRGRK